jgi:LmbE family N-acetylglucosaminyl deacetylase
MRPTLVAFHAHPDDEAIFTGGTIRVAVENGWRVVVVVATDGEEGRPQNDTGSDLGRHRRGEVSVAAAILGVERVEFLGYRDSGFAATLSASPAALVRAAGHEAAGRLHRILREERAVAVTSYDAGGVYGHPDHVRVHEIAAHAVADTLCDVYEATVNRTALLRLRARLLARGLDPDLWPEELTRDMGLEEGAGLVGLDVAPVLSRKLAAIAGTPARRSRPRRSWACPRVCSITSSVRSGTAPHASSTAASSRCSASVSASVSAPGPGAPPTPARRWRSRTQDPDRIDGSTPPGQPRRYHRVAEDDRRVDPARPTAAISPRSRG